MSKEHWDSRYLAVEYIYGTEPNQFLKDFLEGRPAGSILFPAEGEGRNAVYAATLGWTVDAFDQSVNARGKALRLAKERGVNINYFLSQLEDWDPGEKSYDCIVLIFVHLMPDIRKAVHASMIRALKPGGLLVLQAFTKNQLPRTSGGPKDPDLLFDAEDLRSDFKELELLEFSETRVMLDEGPLHQGLADVIQVVGRKGR